jgi:hypothetical protein
MGSMKPNEWGLLIIIDRRALNLIKRLNGQRAIEKRKEEALKAAN